ncbi:thioredoxin domain-containing protein [Hydrogenophaga sp. YM1]|uniref:DsbA family protein n=1 Tax=Hydrogenophaga sp. YM1 TaxID=2806262 RepID=UPI00195A69A5|nr:thioredoxin domain-containing protein [Hydrogenophaga sp. YM1]QRR32259.1 thioredoxin domain-containing protein [Hydrogenophaga sp. YM1]
MKTRPLTTAVLLGVLLTFFALGLWAWQQRAPAEAPAPQRADPARLQRMHSPVLGPAGAPVTIVEFFDPSCEACRAFHPFVKALLAQYPSEVKLVIRYAPFHPGSDSVVKLLEAARRQGLYQPVLEAVLDAQPAWADHAQPNPSLAFAAAKQAGLDIERALQDMQRPEMEALLKQEVEDLNALYVEKTPTFFVNGRGLTRFGPEALAELVAEELAIARRARPAP